MLHSKHTGRQAGRGHLLPTPIVLSALRMLLLQGKGMSSSALPYKRSAPSWLKTTPTEVHRPLHSKWRSDVELLQRSQSWLHPPLL